MPTIKTRFADGGKLDAQYFGAFPTQAPVIDMGINPEMLIKTADKLQAVRADLDAKAAAAVPLQKDLEEAYKIQGFDAANKEAEAAWRSKYKLLQDRVKADPYSIFTQEGRNLKNQLLNAVDKNAITKAEQDFKHYEADIAKANENRTMNQPYIENGMTYNSQGKLVPVSSVRGAVPTVKDVADFLNSSKFGLNKSEKTNFSSILPQDKAFEEIRANFQPLGKDINQIFRGHKFTAAGNMKSGSDAKDVDGDGVPDGIQNLLQTSTEFTASNARQIKAVVSNLKERRTISGAAMDALYGKFAQDKAGQSYRFNQYELKDGERYDPSVINANGDARVVDAKGNPVKRDFGKPVFKKGQSLVNDTEFDRYYLSTVLNMAKGISEEEFKQDVNTSVVSDNAGGASEKGGNTGFMWAVQNGMLETDAVEEVSAGPGATITAPTYNISGNTPIWEEVMKQFTTTGDPFEANGQKHVKGKDIGGVRAFVNGRVITIPKGFVTDPNQVSGRVVYMPKVGVDPTQAQALTNLLAQQGRLMQEAKAFSDPNKPQYSWNVRNDGQQILSELQQVTARIQDATKTGYLVPYMKMDLVTDSKTMEANKNMFTFGSDNKNYVDNASDAEKHNLYNSGSNLDTDAYDEALYRSGVGRQEGNWGLNNIVRAKQVLIELPRSTQWLDPNGESKTYVGREGILTEQSRQQRLTRVIGTQMQ
jgi:hypothetical protein